MTNTAKILNFGRGNFAGQERNVADLDDGYARLSNMLLEAYSGADLTKRQFKVLLAILRKTYGWNKPMDRITDSQLSEITKLPVKRCNEAKLELVRMNIIKQQGGMFGPNKNISEWCIPQNEGKSPKTRDKTSLKLGDCYPSKQGDTKDTITKEKRKDYSSENSGESSDQPENDLSVVKPDAAIQSGSKWGTAEDLTAAEWMFDMVKTIAPSARKPNFAGWANDIRLMRERDGRNHRDMCVLFRWACQDNFWSGNVLSPAKLRDKWTQLEIRRQWVLAFRENGITTMEQVNAGMRVARRQNRPFLPSPGQFVAWCREEASVIAGLPNVSELVDMVYEYCRKRGLYPDAESYPWKSNAHYWLVTNLYQNMRANALTDAELRRKAADELVHMTARINRGEAIPEPVKQLPVMGGRPLNRAQALAKIAEIKAKFGLKGASV